MKNRSNWKKKPALKRSQALNSTSFLSNYRVLVNRGLVRRVTEAHLVEKDFLQARVIGWAIPAKIQPFSRVFSNPIRSQGLLKNLQDIWQGNSSLRLSYLDATNPEKLHQSAEQQAKASQQGTL